MSSPSVIVCGPLPRPPDLVSRTLASAESAADLLDAGLQMSDEIRWIRSYVLAEPSGRVGTVCSYSATSPEAIRDQASSADFALAQAALSALTGCQGGVAVSITPAAARARFLACSRGPAGFRTVSVTLWLRIAAFRRSSRAGVARRFGADADRVRAAARRWRARLRLAAAHRPFFRGFTVGSTPFVAADVRPFFRGFRVGGTPFGAADARTVSTLALTSANARWHEGRLGASPRS